MRGLHLFPSLEKNQNGTQHPVQAPTRGHVKLSVADTPRAPGADVDAGGSTMSATQTAGSTSASGSRGTGAAALQHAIDCVPGWSWRPPPRARMHTHAHTLGCGFFWLAGILVVQGKE